MLPFISKRKVLITQEDVIILLSQNRPFCDQFSSTTKEQFEKIEGMDCVSSSMATSVVRTSLI